MKLEKRASFGWPATAAGPAPCKNGMVAHYDGSNQGLAGKSHEACRTYWKSTRKFHMGPSRGWLDIGYSFGVCPHGYVLEGRGFGHVQAAQPGGNSTWTSATFMSGPSEHPTDAQLKAWGELRAWLRGSHGVAAAVKGHREFVSTSCPGGILWKMVTDGDLKLGAAPSASSGSSAPRWPGTYYQLKTPMMRGSNVSWIQKRLNAKGASPKLAADGVFGPKSDREVRDFQKAHHLDSDGIVGPRTWSALAK